MKNLKLAIDVCGLNAAERQEANLLLAELCGCGRLPAAHAAADFYGSSERAPGFITWSRDAYDYSHCTFVTLQELRDMKSDSQKPESTQDSEKDSGIISKRDIEEIDALVSKYYEMYMIHIGDMSRKYGAHSDYVYELYWGYKYGLDSKNTGKPKAFTKADLQDGDIITDADGARAIVFNGYIAYRGVGASIENYCSNLSHKKCSAADILRVTRQGQTIYARPTTRKVSFMLTDEQAKEVEARYGVGKV